MASARWATTALATAGALLLSCGQLPSASYGTVSGTVSAGPTCPVEQAGAPCPDRPVQTTVRVLSMSGQLVSSTTSDGRGRYVAHVAPGTYLLAVQTAVWPRCPVLRIVVEASAPTKANVLCDTGIR
ncbi:MAG: carboxypeptidase-like regulatory domain-containing protein [Candidatus Dormibacteria bacterium]